MKADIIALGVRIRHCAARRADLGRRPAAGRALAELRERGRLAELDQMRRRARQYVATLPTITHPIHQPHGGRRSA